MVDPSVATVVANVVVVANLVVVVVRVVDVEVALKYVQNVWFMQWPV